MRYYIADCHFFHEQLNDQMDHRGFKDADEMNTYMIHKWNKKVRKNDSVVVLGDFSYGTPEQNAEIFPQLHGTIYLIEGNHDRYLKDKKYASDRFAWIKPYDELHDNQRKVILSHYPIMCYNGQYRLKNNKEPKVYMLYGHVHDTTDQRLIEKFQEITRGTMKMGLDEKMHPIPCHMINCFCMYSDYTPLSLDEWIENDRKRMEQIGSKQNKTL